MVGGGVMSVRGFFILSPGTNGIISPGDNEEQTPRAIIHIHPGPHVRAVPCDGMCGAAIAAPLSDTYSDSVCFQRRVSERLIFFFLHQRVEVEFALPAHFVQHLPRADFGGDPANGARLSNRRATRQCARSIAAFDRRARTRGGNSRLVPPRMRSVFLRGGCAEDRNWEIVFSASDCGCIYVHMRIV